MLYGGSAAQKMIMKHPNHDHLLKVLQETRSELTAGRGFGNGPSEMSPNTEETQSWPSEQQEAYPSAPTSKDSFDEDSLLSDDEINRQNQGGVSNLGKT